MANSPNLAITYLEASQSQKHVTTNDALLALDAIVQLGVLDKDLTAPPSSPVDGQRWIVAPSPTGLWTGKANQVAAWQDNAWRFYVPKAGWFAFVIDESKIYNHNGTSWVLFSTGSGGLPSGSGPQYDPVYITSGTTVGDVFGSGMKTYILSGGATFKLPTAVGNIGTYRIKVLDSATLPSPIQPNVVGQNVATGTGFSAGPGSYYDFISNGANTWMIVNGC